MKMPPPEKIYEAWSALASGRFASQAAPDAASGEAVIVSSGGNKEYRVAWNGNILRSNDPATWWQSYPGYPVLAVLMYRGLLPYDENVARPFANVAWEKINRETKRDYALALQRVFESLQLGQEEMAKARELAKSSFARLESMTLELRRLTGKANAAS